jgi:hypothetical protein
MQKKCDIKIALVAIAITMFALWLSAPISNWLSGLVIGLACYCLIRLWNN